MVLDALVKINNQNVEGMPTEFGDVFAFSVVGADVLGRTRSPRRYVKTRIAKDARSAYKLNREAEESRWTQAMSIEKVWSAPARDHQLDAGSASRSQGGPKVSRALKIG